MRRVWIADNEPLFCWALRSVIKTIPSLTLAGEAAEAEQLLARARNDPRGLIIFELALGRHGGFSLLEDLKRKYREIAILVYSFYPEEGYGLRSLDLGADGFLSKTAPIKELVRAIQTVAAGRRFVTSSLKTAFVARLDSLNNKRNGEPPALSHREHKVAEMIIAGVPLKSIASELNLNAKTVTSYRTRILEKLGLNSNAELIRYSMERGLQ